MTEKDVPTVSGELSPIYEGKQVVNWSIKVTCPHCGKHHYHGLASAIRPGTGAKLGHRVSDCGAVGGYFIVAK